MGVRGELERGGVEKEGLGDAGGGDYDVVVVGSGYGGSIAACRLAAAGVDVCLIERGRRWAAGDFPTNVVGLLSAVRVESQENRTWKE
ncbi:hypothetical protein QJS10_CPA02g01008 [Acorus calamus]|uniref:Uncharacterized protein n=1 Tax=Acorus calamus TaxID=4465 RepID=A0AAV9FDP5_ACOCL|nr:hypothetical protein QJS10_CPA02g01008 [Acorus calamus]